MLIKWIQTIFVVSVSLFFVSCQTVKSKTWTSQDILISEQLTVESIAFPKTLSSEQAAEDIDFLIYVLTKGYGGRQYVPQDSFLAAIRALKVIPGTLSMDEFHQKIDEALFLIPDNHMRSYYMGRVSKKRRDYEAKSEGAVGRNNITDPKKIWEVRLDKVGKKKVLYVAIVKFPSHEDKIWDGFIPSVKSQLKQADSVVIDLRGNSGGDDTMGMELAKVLFGRAFEHPIKRQYRSQTPETLALSANRFAIEIIHAKYDGQKVPEHTFLNLEDAKKTFNSALKGEIPVEFIRTDKGTGNRTDAIAGYKKPIYILIDGSCGSSGEFTIAALEWHSYVKRVGENTNGTFHFSNAGIAILPHSKLKVFIPTQYSEYYDHRFIERIGLTPDIKVLPGEDAYLAVKKMIASP